jgi:prepilin-type N-terminal cleavage/methylation domain-containing protein
MDRSLRHSLRGFSLIEVVIIVALVAILAVAANTSWMGLTINLDGQAEQMASDLRFAQVQSMTQGNRYCLVITGSSYQLINSASNTAMTFAMGNTSVTLGNGISFGTVTPSGAALFVFDGTGVPYYSTATSCSAANATAATALTSTASITLSTSSATKTISISPETGRVFVQ